MRGIVLTILFAALLSGAALAHEGVTGPTKIRMDLMKDIGKATKTLGKMAKSGTFDRPLMVDLAGVIARQGARVDEVFTDRHMHPKTEALPAIWEEWETFSAQGRDMVEAAHAIETRAMTKAADEAWLRTAIKDLGATCKACHDDFKKD
ncbi:MAG: cytochrome c [Pseudomonadota bacterium]